MAVVSMPSQAWPAGPGFMAATACPGMRESVWTFSMWIIGPWDLISLFYRKLLCYFSGAMDCTVQKPWAAIIIQKEQFRMNQKKLPVESKQDTAEVDVSG